MCGLQWVSHQQMYSERERDTEGLLSYLGDEDAIAFQQGLFVLAATQELPDFGSQGLGDAGSHQHRQPFRTRRQVPMPDKENAHKHTQTPISCQCRIPTQYTFFSLKKK